jgi:hypothetical protein
MVGFNANRRRIAEIGPISPSAKSANFWPASTKCPTIMGSAGALRAPAERDAVFRPTWLAPSLQKTRLPAVKETLQHSASIMVMFINKKRAGEISYGHNRSKKN